MRFIGTMHPTDGGIPVFADHQATAVLSAVTAQAFDYPEGTDFVRLAGATTASGAYAFAFNASSTKAVWPSASTLTTESTALNAIVPAGKDMVYQRPRGSTGFSLISGTSGIVSAEFWSRAAP